MVKNNVTVIGSGRWGSFIAWYLNRIGRNVLIYGRENSERFNSLRIHHGNQYVKYDDSVSYTDDLKKAVDFADEIYISILKKSSTQKYGHILIPIHKHIISFGHIHLCKVLKIFY